MFSRKKNIFAQYDSMDCAPACLKMIAQFYGKLYSLDFLREKCYLGKEGVSLANISEAAESIGFRTIKAKLTIEILENECPLPAVLHWNQEHFVVLYKIKNKKKYIIADPAHGLVTIDKVTFLKAWISTSDDKGIALLLEPSKRFFSNNINDQKNNNGYSFIFQYLFPYKKYLLQLIIGMLATSIITLSFPFFTQLLIDVGIVNKSMSIVYLIAFSQLFLFLGDTAIEIVRSWLLLHINTRISLNIISDFLIKLLKLPIKFFDTKAVGDISQRINDHHRIENFLTGSLLNSIFSIVNIIVFTIILAYYDWKILAVFILLSIIAIIWVFLFNKKRKELDYKRFIRNKENQDKLYEMITGMQEIKLYGSEINKRWEWEQLQVNYFILNIKSLTLEQYQNSGYIFFSHLKNIIISFIASSEVIKGNMTLGTLLSISYIIGQTNSPIEQLINFIKSAQDARLSMDRLKEIYDKDDEEIINKDEVFKIQNTILHKDIEIQNLSFQYDGPHSPTVLKNINMIIPKGKITAIVGASGSGKTTLMKILLGYYKPSNGMINIGKDELHKISPRLWRKHCGTVMQDGYIFYDTIAKNIAMNGNEIDEEKMRNAIKIANLENYIENIPLKYTTKIGASGIGISGGQKQRILIARSVYKNPDYLFFDEATSNLDSNNEKIIMENLNNYFKGKTVIVIAHRLSTVKNADQIIVLENGEISEMGTHDSLIKIKGRYFELIRNQLELES